jgi:hypothetical protein
VLHFGFCGVLHFSSSLLYVPSHLRSILGTSNSTPAISSHTTSNPSQIHPLDPSALRTPHFHASHPPHKRRTPSAKPSHKLITYPKRTMLCASNQHLSLILPIAVINPNPILRNLYAPQVSAGFSCAPTSALYQYLVRDWEEDFGEDHCLFWD